MEFEQDTFENVHALLIGIADYQHVHPLPASILNDVADVHDILIAPAYSGYDSDKVHVLTNAAATREAILAALADLANHTNAHSTVVLYISAHGGRIESGATRGEYLLPVEVDMQTTHSLAYSAISSGEFTDAVRKLTSRKLLVILDRCYASGIGHPKGAGESELKIGFSPDLYQSLAAGDVV